MFDQVLGYLILLLFAIVAVGAFVAIPWLLDKLAKGTAGYLIAAVFVGGALFNLFTAPGAFDRAALFRESAQEKTGEITAVEERDVGTGGKTTRHWVFRVVVRDAGEEQREFALSGTLAKGNVGDEVKVYIHGDDAYWDRDFSAYWYGPWKRIGVGLVMLCIGIPAFVTTIRERGSRRRR